MPPPPHFEHSPSGLLEYDDLEIHVLDRTDAGYPVHSRSSRLGEAHGLSCFDPDADWVRDILSLLEAGLLPLNQLEPSGHYLLRGTAELAARPDDLSPPFHGLLRGEVLEHVLNCWTAALSNPGRGLRIWLRIEPPELAAIPWEYVFEERRRVFPATDPRVTLARLISAPLPARPLATPFPLRGLLITARTGDLELEGERAALEAAAEASSGRLVWQHLPGPDLAGLRQALEQTPLHIVHFSGHGLHEREGKLYLEGAGGQAVSERLLADLVQANPSIRLIVLNACHSGTRDPAVFGGFAQRLLFRDVPAVVAMQQAVPDEHARRFALSFYRHLIVGPEAGDVARAVNLARSELLVAGREAAAEPTTFGAPVLYLRAPAPRLFTPQPAGADVAAAAPAAPIGGHAAPVSVEGSGQVREDSSVAGDGNRTFARSLRDRISRTLAGLAIVWLALVLRGAGVFERLDTWRHDLYVRHFVSVPKSDAIRIVDVGVRPPDVPWRRALLAELLERLAEAGAARAVVDVALGDTPGTAEAQADFDAANARIVAVSKRLRVVIAAPGTLEPPGDDTPYYVMGPVPPPRGLEALPRGHVGLVPTRPGDSAPKEVRWLPLLARCKAPGEGTVTVDCGSSPGGTAFMRALVATSVVEDVAANIPKDAHQVDLGDRDLAVPQVLVGRHWIRTDPYYRVELPPPLSLEPHQLLGLWEIVGASPGGRQALEARLANTTVLIGRLAGGEDRHRLPWSDADGSYEQPGLVVHASSLATMLSGRPIHRVPNTWERMLQLLLVGGAALALLRRPVHRRALQLCVVLLAVAVVIEVAVLTSRLTHAWIDAPVVELVALTLWGVGSRAGSSGPHSS